MQFIGVNSPGPGVGWTNTNKTWTSPLVNSNTADTITGSLFSDQAGNLTVSQSGDGVNFDVVDTIAVTASTGTRIGSAQTITAIGITVWLPFVQIAFVATTTAPVTFRLYARLSSAGVQP